MELWVISVIVACCEITWGMMIIEKITGEPLHYQIGDVHWAMFVYLISVIVLTVINMLGIFVGMIGKESFGEVKKK